MGKHKSYNARFKLRAVEIATKKSKMAASREFGVDPKRIREWCKQKESLMKLKNKGKSKKKRLCGGGRKANEEDMEDTLFDLRRRNLGVSRAMIMRQAKVFSPNESFKSMAR